VAIRKYRIGLGILAAVAFIATLVKLAIIFPAYAQGIGLTFWRSELAIGYWMHMGITAWAVIAIIMCARICTIGFWYGVALNAKRFSDPVRWLRNLVLGIRRGLRTFFEISAVYRFPDPIAKIKKWQRRAAYAPLPVLSLVSEGTSLAAFLAVSQRLNHAIVITILLVTSFIESAMLALSYKTFLTRFNRFLPLAINIGWIVFGIVTAYLVVKFMFSKEDGDVLADDFLDPQEAAAVMDEITRDGPVN